MKDTSCDSTLYSYCRVITQDRLPSIAVGARRSDELAVEYGIRMNMTAVASVGWDICNLEEKALVIDLSCHHRLYVFLYAYV